MRGAAALWVIVLGACASSGEIGSNDGAADVGVAVRDGGGLARDAGVVSADAATSVGDAGTADAATSVEDAGTADATPAADDAAATSDDATPAADDAAAPADDAAARDAAPAGSDAAMDAGARDAAIDAGVRDAATGAPDASTAPDGGGTPATVCAPPIALAPTGSPTTVVGTGTAQSCTEAAFTAAIAAGGVITFSCGAAPVTIPITAEKQLRTDRDTIIDGGGRITLDGGHTTRVLRFYSANYRATRRRVVLQRITIANGRATGTPLPPAVPPLSQGFGVDGGGGAIFVRDGLLHVIDAVFRGNECAPLGPDVGGGAIYALGSLDVTIVGARFEGNSGANGGAVGILQSTLTMANTVLVGNHAVGHGANALDAMGRQIGSGGLGGAVYMDGHDTGASTWCGVEVRGNDSLSHGGGLFRVAEVRSPMTFDRVTFDANVNLPPPASDPTGGGAAYLQGLDATWRDSAVTRNVSRSAGGGLRAHDSTLNMTNVTLALNASQGLGGAMFVTNDVNGRIQSCTFAANAITAGAGLFSAAIGAPGGAGFTVADTVFAGHTTNDPFNPITCSFAPFTDGGGNVQWPRTRPGGGQDNACTAGVLWADPLLGALGAHGGPTETMVPGAGSPALGRGASCPAHDQRGVARPAQGCAAGAVEPP